MKNPDDDLIVPKTIFSFLLGRGAYFDATVLHERIANSISKSVVEQLALGASDNRVLLVGATNLDYGVMRVWDLASIASQNSTQNARKSNHNKVNRILCYSQRISSGAYQQLVVRRWRSFYAGGERY